MARVTSKLQVTIPKAVADRYRIAPGAEVAFEPAGDVIRVVPRRKARRPAPARLKLFRQILARQREREAAALHAEADDRGWTREQLDDRGRSR